MEVHHINNLHFNENIHVDTFPKATETSPSMIMVLDEHTAYSIYTVIQNKNRDNIVWTPNNHWFNKSGFPQQIHLKEGKVKVSKLAQKIKKWHLFDDSNL